MSAPYTPVTISGFNTNPPSNDGQKIADNQADWSVQVVGKIGTPLKTAIEQIDTNLTTAFAKTFGGAGIVEPTSAYVVQPSDQSKSIVYQGSGAHTHTTPDATAVDTPFWFLFINAGSAITTLDGFGSQTINGSANITFRPGEGAIIVTDGTNWFSSWVSVDNPVLAKGQTFDGSVADGEVVFWDTGSSVWGQAQANTANNAAVGIADVTNGNVYFSGLLPTGLVSGLTPGAKQYLSGATPGALTETAPGTEDIRIGWATTATQMVIDVDLLQKSPDVFSTADLTNSGANDLTEYAWTGLPTGLNRITLAISGVSLTGTDEIQVRLGDATTGGYLTTGYVGGVREPGTAGGTTYSTSMLLTRNSAAVDTISGVINLARVTGNVWSLSGNVAPGDETRFAGTITLAGALDRMKIMVSGTDTFDGGNASINYQDFSNV